VFRLGLLLAAAFVGAAAAAPTANSPVVARVTTGGSPCGIAGTPGAVWVTDAEAGELLRLDPATNAVTGRFRVHATPCELRLAKGSLLVVTQSGRLERVDPATGRIVKSIEVGRTTYDAAYGRFLFRISPKTYRFTRIRSGGAGASWVAANGRDVWVSNTSDGTVSRIDAVRRKLVSTTKVGAGPVNLDVVDGDVWVPNDQDDTVWRLDGATGAVRETISTGPNPAVVAGAAGDVWVSIFEGGQVWRIHPG